MACLGFVREEEPLIDQIFNLVVVYFCGESGAPDLELECGSIDDKRFVLCDFGRVV